MCWVQVAGVSSEAAKDMLSKVEEAVSTGKEAVVSTNKCNIRRSWMGKVDMMSG